MWARPRALPPPNARPMRGPVKRPPSWQRSSRSRPKARPVRHGRRMRIGGGPVAYPPGDALQDRRDPEEIIGEIDVEVIESRAPGAPAIVLNIASSERKARVVLMAFERADARPGSRNGHMPLHEVIGEIGHRISEGRQFPVEYRDNARLVQIYDAIVKAEVAVDDRRA